MVIGGSGANRVRFAIPATADYTKPVGIVCVELCDASLALDCA
jgi:hypothetical protein